MLGLAGETGIAKYPANDEMGAQSLLRGGASIGRKSCATTRSHRFTPPGPKDVRDVPDMLVAAQLSLRSLARDEATASSAEAKRIVGDACDLLVLRW
jgi:hypothetical protein